MAIDPSIPMSYRGFNLGDIMAQSQQMRLREFQMQQAQQERQDQLAEREAYRNLYTPEGTINKAAIPQLGAVNPKAAFEVQKYLGSLDEDRRKLEGQRFKAAGPIAVKAKRMPYQVRKQFLASASPFLLSQGWSPEEIQSFDPTDEALDSIATAAMTMEQVLSDGRIDWKQIGGEAGGLAAFDQMGNPVGSGNPYAGAAVNGAAPFNPSNVVPAGSVDPDLFEALIKQESGGDGNAISSQGALGSTQMLPGTAQEMAQKLGLPWRPELMRNTSPEAIQYQRALGQAYLQEGMERYGGDTRKALMYYHGGPDERIWGPKTRAYPDQVLSRLGGQETAQAAPRPGFIPGGGKTREAPSGFRWVGDRLEAIPGGPADKPGRGQFQIVSEAEAQQLGLPPGKYQRAPDGEIKPLGGTAGQGPTRQQIGLAKAKLANLRGLEGQIGRVERAMTDVEKEGWTGAISGLVPGRLDKESNVFDKAVRGVASLVRQLTRVPGEGAMSDYESRLAEMTLPSRTDTPEGRREAVAGIKELIANIRSGYQEMLGVSDPGAGAKTGGSVDDILRQYGVQ